MGTDVWSGNAAAARIIYEGQGPEHSSARLERYLQLCAEQNIQVCVPSTPAQGYHMLRRQALRNMRRPLIVMLPKSLLRHPLVLSSLDELANGTFQSAIGEVDNLDQQGVKRVVMCSGKVYYDLLDQRRKSGQQDVAIVSIEQLHPFPAAGDSGGTGPLCARSGLRLVPGGAAKSGRLVLQPAPFPRSNIQGRYAGLYRSSRIRLAGGRVFVRTPDPAKNLVNDALNVN